MRTPILPGTILGDGYKVLKPFYDYLVNVLMNEIGFFKDAAFIEEDEVRVVRWIADTQNSINEIEFSMPNDTVRPHIELIRGQNYGGEHPLRLPIREIYVGPLPNPDQSTKTLNMMLHKFGYENVEVRRSEIPLC